MGFVVKPGTGHIKGIYISWPGDEDIVDEIFNATGLKKDLLHGLAFGYKMSDVMNYIRSSDKELVDRVAAL